MGSQTFGDDAQEDMGAPTGGSISADLNARIAGYLGDLAETQTVRQKALAYRRAAAAVFGLEAPVSQLVAGGLDVTSIQGIGPSSARVITEVLTTGESPTVERALAAGPRRIDIERIRRSRAHVLSRAAVLAVLQDETLGEPRSGRYRSDFQMHSEWSDGTPTLDEIGAGCVARGYTHAAVTDHSHGLAIAGGMSISDATRQRAAIDGVNQALDGRFRLLQGIEANIDADGALDLASSELARFEMVLAAPHSLLRKTHDQTARLVAAVRVPGVHVLAHPRGRQSGARTGVEADWDAVFAACVEANVAIEIDGDPARQDLDHPLARRALAAGCLFALDSDAHTVGQLAYAETAIAHARLAAIPEARILNYWPLERLVAWLAERRRP